MNVNWIQSRQDYKIQIHTERYWYPHVEDFHKHSYRENIHLIRMLRMVRRKLRKAHDDCVYGVCACVCLCMCVCVRVDCMAPITAEVLCARFQIRLSLSVRGLLIISRIGDKYSHRRKA